MPRRQFIAGSTAGMVLAAHSDWRVLAQERATTGPETGYAPVNGLSLYYEIHGSGEPLILLHGGAVGIVMFGTNVAELAKNRKVIAVELQGHGRTADINRPLSFEAMADDIAGLMMAARRMLAWTGLEGLRTSWPFCPASRITTLVLRPCCQRS